MMRFKLYKLSLISLCLFAFGYNAVAQVSVVQLDCAIQAIAVGSSSKNLPSSLISAKTLKGENLLMRMIRMRRVDLVEEFVQTYPEQANEISQSNESALSIAISIKNYDLVRSLLPFTSVLKTSTLLKNPLNQILQDHQYDLAVVIISKLKTKDLLEILFTGSPAAIENSNLLEASVLGSLIARNLLVSSKVRSSIYANIWTNRNFEALKAMSAFAEEREQILLMAMEATLQKDEVAARQFASKLANINEATWTGETLLMIAAEMDLDQLVQFLLDRGGDIKMKDKFGMNSHDHAIQAGSTLVLDLLK